MVLPPIAYGDFARDLRIDVTSGFQNSTDIADASLDASVSAFQIRQSGFRAAYALGLDDYTYLSVRKGAGVNNVGSFVILFDSEDAATGYLADRLAELHEFQGQEVQGALLEDTKEFEVPRLGAEAKVTVTHSSALGLDWRVSSAWFRKGPLVASVFITRTDDRDIAREVARLGGALAYRIEQVANGYLNQEPVPIPAGIELGEDDAPRIPPFPSDMVLRFTDLPLGAQVEEEFYEPDSDGSVEYERSFDIWGLVLGESRPVNLSSSVELYADELLAKGNFDYQDWLVSTPKGRDLFEQALINEIEGDVEGEVTVLQLVGRGLPNLGDAGTAVSVTVSVSDAEVKVLLLIFRVERAIGTLVAAASIHGELYVADFLDLAEVMAQRMEQVFAADP